MGFAYNIGWLGILFKQIRTQIAWKQSVPASATEDVPDGTAGLGLCLLSGQADICQCVIVKTGKGAALAAQFQHVEKRRPTRLAEGGVVTARERGHGGFLSKFVMKLGASLFLLMYLA